MKPGDTVEVEIEGIGVMRTPVMAASSEPQTHASTQS
jgi:hypothetical protein